MSDMHLPRPLRQHLIEKHHLTPTEASANSLDWLEGYHVGQHIRIEAETSDYNHPETEQR